MKVPDFHSIVGLIFSIFKTSEVQVNQAMFCKLKLGMFVHCAFDGHVEPQLTS